MGSLTGVRCATPPDPGSRESNPACPAVSLPFKQPTHSKVALNIARLVFGVTTLLAACLLASSCASVQPGPLGASALAEAQTFPFFRVYWVGPRFGSEPLAAADGLRNYISSVGDSVYYGNCATGKGAGLGGNGCVLPLQVTTLVYARHANAPLGPQRNTVLRGVPAVIFDGGDSIELYTGRLAVDVFSEGLSDGLRAASALRPLNAPGSATAPLPPPVYCPGLSGPRPAAVQAALRNLPGHACQRVAATLAVDRALFGKG